MIVKKILGFLFPVPSVIIMIVCGIILCLSNTQEAQMTLLIWFLCMIIIFFVFVIPFDVFYLICKVCLKAHRRKFSKQEKIESEVCEQVYLNENYDTKIPENELTEEELKKSYAEKLINILNVVIKEKERFDYDSMDGHSFEHFCADVLKHNGFYNVSVTKASGDHGIDIIAEKDDIGYAIQCKCYSSNLGNSAVQQANAGKIIYKKDIAVVLTNQYFTQQAKEEARILGVKLWDRDKLNDLIANRN